MTTARSPKCSTRWARPCTRQRCTSSARPRPPRTSCRRSSSTWRQPHRFDPALGSLRTYLTLSARHRAYDLLRSELRRVGREERHHRLVPPQRQSTPDEEVVDALTASAVRDAIRALPAEQRQVVEMAYFGGLSYRDVARAVGISEGTAKSRIRLALAKLEIMLDRQLLESS